MGGPAGKENGEFLRQQSNSAYLVAEDQVRGIFQHRANQKQGEENFGQKLCLIVGKVFFRASANCPLQQSMSLVDVVN